MSARRMTEPQRAALVWLTQRSRPVRAAQYARAAYDKRGDLADTARRRVARARAAGALFERMHSYGWVTLIEWEHGVPLFTITDAGRDALRREAAPEVPPAHPPLTEGTGR